MSDIVNLEKHIQISRHWFDLLQWPNRASVDWLKHILALQLQMHSIVFQIQISMPPSRTERVVLSNQDKPETSILVSGQTLQPSVISS